MSIPRILRWTSLVLFVSIPVVGWFGRPGYAPCPTQILSPCDPVPIWHPWAWPVVTTLALVAVTCLVLAAVLSHKPADERP